jgi:hypothetical protein
MSRAIAAGANIHRNADCSILSTIMPHAAVTTDVVRILRSVLEWTCWQCTHAVNVEIVTYRSSVSKNSIVKWNRYMCPYEFVSRMNTQRITTIVRKIDRVIAECFHGNNI